MPLRFRFGICHSELALLFGVISANDFTHSLVVTKFSSLTAPAQFFYEALILFALGSWVPIARCRAGPQTRGHGVNSTSTAGTRSPPHLGHTGTPSCRAPACQQLSS